MKCPMCGYRDHIGDIIKHSPPSYIEFRALCDRVEMMETSVMAILATMTKLQEIWERGSK